MQNLRTIVITFALIVFICLVTGCSEVFYYDDDGTLISSAKTIFFLKHSRIEPPVKEGYDFKYWSLASDGEKYSFDEYLPDGTQLFAVWQKKSYTIEFYDKENLIEVRNVNHKNSLENIPSISRNGQCITGWENSVDGSLFEIPTPITKNYVLNAIWGPCEYEVTFYDRDQMLEVFSVSHGSPLPRYVPQKDGYTFKYWSLDINEGEPFDEATEITSHVNLYGQFNLKEYMINFLDSEGLNYYSDSVNHGETISFLPEIPQKTDYSFKHWALDAKGTIAYDFSNPITTDLTLYPVWTLNLWTPTFYKSSSMCLLVLGISVFGFYRGISYLKKTKPQRLQKRRQHEIDRQREIDEITKKENETRLQREREYAEQQRRKKESKERSEKQKLEAEKVFYEKTDYLEFYFNYDFINRVLRLHVTNDSGNTRTYKIPGFRLGSADLEVSGKARIIKIYNNISKYGIQNDPDTIATIISEIRANHKYTFTLIRDNSEYKTHNQKQKQQSEESYNGNYSSSIDNFLSTLRLNRDIQLSKEKLTEAFHNLCLAYHPDRYPSGRKAWAEEEMKKVNEAYDALMSYFGYKKN